MLSKSEQKLIFRFMETTMKHVNACMARIWALEKLLMEKGVAIPSDMKKRIKDAEHQPTHVRNVSILEDMIKEFNQQRLHDEG